MSEKKTPTSETEKIKRKIKESVGKVIEDFKNNPFLFMSERDLQAHLFSLLRKNIDQQLEFSYKDNNYETNVINHKTSIINTEYSHIDPGWKDFIDIVCLHPIKAKEAIETHPQEDKLNQYLWSLPVLAGIELKLIRFDENKGAEIGDNDEQKLKKFNEKYNKVREFVWLVLCFYQNKKHLKKLTGKELFNNEIRFNQIYLIGDEELYVRTRF